MFLLIAVFCIPWMLVPKPLILIYCGDDHHKVSQEDDDRQGGDRLLSGENMEESNVIESKKGGAD